MTNFQPLQNGKLPVEYASLPTVELEKMLNHGLSRINEGRNAMWVEAIKKELNFRKMFA